MSASSSNKESTADVLVLESSVDLCQQVRKELLDKFPNVWLYVWTKGSKSKNAYITVANSFGGKLEKQTLTTVTAYAREFHATLKN